MIPSESGGPSGAVKVAPSAMLLAGHVGRLTILQTRGGSTVPSLKVNCVSLNIQSYVGEEGKDVSRGWPAIENVKQKEVNTVLPHTRKLLVFLGSNTAHRTPNALTKRWAQAWAQRLRQHGRPKHGRSD